MAIISIHVQKCRCVTRLCFSLLFIAIKSLHMFNEDFNKLEHPIRQLYVWQGSNVRPTVMGVVIRHTFFRPLEAANSKSSAQELLPRRIFPHRRLPRIRFLSRRDTNHQHANVLVPCLFTFEWATVSGPSCWPALQHCILASQQTMNNIEIVSAMSSTTISQQL